MARVLLDSHNAHHCVSIDKIGSLRIFTRQVSTLTICGILPRVGPRFSTLLRRAVDHTFSVTPNCRNFHRLPNVNDLPSRITRHMITRLSTGTCKTIGNSFRGPRDNRLARTLVRGFTRAFGTRVRRGRGLRRLRALLVSFLRRIGLGCIGHLTTRSISHLVRRHCRLCGIARNSC